VSSVDVHLVRGHLLGGLQLQVVSSLVLVIIDGSPYPTGSGLHAKAHDLHTARRKAES